MSRIGESICLKMNSLFGKVPSYAEPGEEYSKAEYREVSKLFDEMYGSYDLDLKDKVVLDAGCGAGGKTVYYAKQGCRHVYGTDREPYLIEKAGLCAREHDVEDNITFQIESLDDMTFESNMFDVVFLTGVLEHIVRPKLVPAMVEIKRVLKPGGRLFLNFPPWSSPYAAHLYKVIFIPWCQYMFSDQTLVNAANRLGAPTSRGVSTSYTEHFMELNRCTIAEFRKMVKDLGFDAVDIEQVPVKKKVFLTKLPLVGPLFVSGVRAVLSKSDPSPAKLLEEVATGP